MKQSDDDMETEEREVTTVNGQDPSKGKHLLEQVYSDLLNCTIECLTILKLRDVFNACDTEGQGYISLEELADMSRSHVSRAQVDQILEILGPGEEGKDRVDFDEFYLKFVEYMRNGVKQDNDNGMFNQNLKRAFEKDEPFCKSSSKVLKRRPSQVVHYIASYQSCNYYFIGKAIR